MKCAGDASCAAAPSKAPSCLPTLTGARPRFHFAGELRRLLNEKAHSKQHMYHSTLRLKPALRGVLVLIVYVRNPEDILTVVLPNLNHATRSTWLCQSKRFALTA